MATTLNKLTQADIACDTVRSEILDGTLPPGVKLNIKALEARIGVSLGAIREGLSRLSVEGMVVAEARRGYRVASVSREELLDLTRTRVEIESLCLAQATEHGNVEWESRIVAAVHRMERLQDTSDAVEPRSTVPWNEAHAEFHEALVSACPSEWLLRLRMLLYKQSERYRLLSVPLDTDYRDVRQEHRDLSDAVLRRDQKATRELLEAHLFATTKIILRSPLLTVDEHN